MTLFSFRSAFSISKMQAFTLGSCRVWYVPSLELGVVLPPQGTRCVMWNTIMFAALIAFRYVEPETLIADHHLQWIILVVFTGLNALLASLTAFSDPGILPPVNPEEARNDDGSQLLAGNEILEEFFPSACINSEGSAYCGRCRHLRPPQCAHCYGTGLCILEMDHYCIILGCTVGARNLRWFVSYLASVALSGLLAMWMLHEGVQRAANIGKGLTVLLLLFCITLVTVLGTAYFFLTSIFRIVNGQTTRGSIKGHRAEGSTGLQALSRLWCPAVPSLIPHYWRWTFEHTPDTQP